MGITLLITFKTFMSANKPPVPPSDFLSNLEKKLRGENQENPKQAPEPPKKEPGQPGGGRTNLFTLLLVVTLIVLSIYYLNNSTNKPKLKSVPYTEFIDGVKKHTVVSCEVINNDHVVFSQDGIQKETKIPYLDNQLLPLLIDNKVSVDAKQVEDSKLWLILASWLPWIVIMAVVYFVFSRQFRGGRMGNAFTFGKSRARMLGESEIKTTFRDVEGCDEAKDDLKEIVSFLKDPKKYADIGAKIPKGVLLVGPPGTGKTLLAKAVAGEAKVPFFSMSGSDFVEMFVGVGASRVRDLFENGKKHAPCIIFIDEIDAVGRTRGAGFGGGHDEREQTLNQLLVEMDGFDTNDAVIIMAATNRADVLDRALLRPGRFDRQVVVDVPDVKGRLGILSIHSKKIKLSPDVKLEDVARGTPGFTGADLANLINEGALFAGRANRKEVTQQDLELAKDKVMMGSERRSMLISVEEKKNTAYHEAGHALVGILLDKANALHKVSIIPRGRALGLTYFFPEDGKKTMSKTKVEAELQVLYGGRVAEELVFKDYTTGASNDIERATKIAHAMVCEWGMSRLGPISFGEKDQPVFIGREVSRQDDFSDDTARIIDTEVKRILDTAYRDTAKLLKANMGKLKVLAETLLEKETLDAFEVYDLLKMKKPKVENISLDSPPEPPAAKPQSGPSVPPPPLTPIFDPATPPPLPS
jgi:cell division protease FtsH